MWSQKIFFLFRNFLFYKSLLSKLQLRGKSKAGIWKEKFFKSAQRSQYVIQKTIGHVYGKFQSWKTLGTSKKFLLVSHSLTLKVSDCKISVIHYEEYVTTAVIKLLNTWLHQIIRYVRKAWKEIKVHHNTNIDSLIIRGVRGLKCE